MITVTRNGATTGRALALAFLLAALAASLVRGNGGKTLLGSAAVSTNGTGDASFAFSTKKAIRLGQNITATATGAHGTSEFSAARKVVAR